MSTGFVVLDPKGNGFLTDFKDSGVADGDLVGISTQVLNDLISTFKRLFEVGNPLFGIQFCQKPVEFGRVFKDAEVAREGRACLRNSALRPSRYLPLKSLETDLNGKEKFLISSQEPTGCTEATAQNNGVNMWMKGQITAPSMKDTDEMMSAPKYFLSRARSIRVSALALYRRL